MSHHQNCDRHHSGGSSARGISANAGSVPVNLLLASGDNEEVFNYSAGEFVPMAADIFKSIVEADNADQTIN